MPTLHCPFKLFLSLIALFKEISNEPKKHAIALDIQAPEINTLANEDGIKRDELATHFEYISTILNQ